ncbi:hypothetical protein GOQ29_11820 [Clostridium sp. D2Q-14]|uniref:DUF6179 domain-containing protein n=1 Tax=Anaeromonas gelatinilytica TaxID=2683194 RepID=UPI00193C43E3|nr:DUF6179 domain-containing protein [Anaeromonas gelatinilytica]MBS4536306.1 hypothetical protein [Anaeromonas gelatinilytica]
MGNIEKSHIVDSNNLSGEFYFTSLLREAYKCGILYDSDVENVQMQSIKLLSYKSERYNNGESSSIRVEVAESIMKSNLYTIGLYLKSLPDVDCAAEELKKVNIFDMYKKGRKIINAKFHTAKHMYKLNKKNKLTTFNYTYNATLSENGIGIFFKSYDPDYEAHECPASIDYQLFGPVNDLAGVEFIQKYLENLYYENEFCKNFATGNIHNLLYGYDEGYKDLLINIFEQVLISALGCSLANCNIFNLNISKMDIQYLYNEFSKYDDYTFTLKITEATEKIFEELNITSIRLQRYIKQSLSKLIPDMFSAFKTKTLEKVFISPINPKLEPKVHFRASVKMNDNDYRKLIDELSICRYSSDKLALVKKKVKSFDDLEDILLDVQWTEEEIISIFDNFRDIEVAIMIKRHPFNSNVEATDLSESEQMLRLCLKKYIDQLTLSRQKQISQMVNHIIEE